MQHTVGVSWSTAGGSDPHALHNLRDQASLLKLLQYHHSRHHIVQTNVTNPTKQSNIKLVTIETPSVSNNHHQVQMTKIKHRKITASVLDQRSPRGNYQRDVNFLPKTA